MCKQVLSLVHPCWLISLWRWKFKFCNNVWQSQNYLNPAKEVPLMLINFKICPELSDCCQWQSMFVGNWPQIHVCHIAWVLKLSQLHLGHVRWSHETKTFNSVSRKSLCCDRVVASCWNLFIWYFIVQFKKCTKAHNFQPEYWKILIESLNDKFKQFVINQCLLGKCKEFC